MGYLILLLLPTFANFAARTTIAWLAQARPHDDYQPSNFIHCILVASRCPYKAFSRAWEEPRRLYYVMNKWPTDGWDLLTRLRTSYHVAGRDRRY